MTEANVHPSNAPDPAGGAGAADDPAGGSRLPPVPRPPPLRVGSVLPPPPTPPSVVIAPDALAPQHPSADVWASASNGVFNGVQEASSKRPSTDGRTAPPTSADPAVLQKTSWWKALLASTMPPPPVTLLPLLVQTRVALALFGLSAATVIVAVVIGLRGVPSYSLSAPTVAAAVVVARALVALGLVAFALALWRTGERSLTHMGRVRSDDERS